MRMIRREGFSYRIKKNTYKKIGKIRKSFILYERINKNKYFSIKILIYYNKNHDFLKKSKLKPSKTTD